LTRSTLEILANTNTGNCSIFLLHVPDASASSSSLLSSIRLRRTGHSFPPWFLPSSSSSSSVTFPTCKIPSVHDRYLLSTGFCLLLSASAYSSLMRQGSIACVRGLTVFSPRSLGEYASPQGLGCTGATVTRSNDVRSCGWLGLTMLGVAAVSLLGSSLIPIHNDNQSLLSFDIRVSSLQTEQKPISFLYCSAIRSRTVPLSRMLGGPTSQYVTSSGNIRDAQPLSSAHFCAIPHTEFITPCMPSLTCSHIEVPVIDS
jgi:hypothetical protein